MATNPVARRRLRLRLRDLFSRIAVRLSPSRSSRYGAKVIGAVIHTTESPPGSIEGVVNYLRVPSVQVSSHYVVGDLAGKGELWTKVIQLVPESEKAWTARSANPSFVQYELVGRASRTRADWLGAYRVQLETVAALVADDVLQYGFPVARAVPGIVGHGDLRKWGFPNDHTDPGHGFPWDVFLRRVRHYVSQGTFDRPDTPSTLRVRRGGGGFVAE